MKDLILFAWLLFMAIETIGIILAVIRLWPLYRFFDDQCRQLHGQGIILRIFQVLRK